MATPILDYTGSKPTATRAPWLKIALFTLAPLLLFIAICSMFRTYDYGREARIQAAKSDLNALGVLIDQFKTDVGRWPSTDESLDALIVQPAQTAGWRGPYLKRQARPNDPWGQPYLYERTVSHAVIGFKLTSGGPDERIGTNDDLTFTAP